MSSHRNSREVQRPNDPRSYKIAIICALETEAKAVSACFDREFIRSSERPVADSGDWNSYAFGVICNHFVLLATVANDIGNVAAANVAAHLVRAFPDIRVCLLVGVCAIVPSVSRQEPILGDVVVSTGIFYYTKGHMHPAGMIPKDTVEACGPKNVPLKRHLTLFFRPQVWDAFCIQTKDELKKLMRNKFMIQDQYGYPGRDTDVLYDSDYLHKHRKEDCVNCEQQRFCRKASKSSCEEMGCPDGMPVARDRVLGAVHIDAAQYAPINNNGDPDYELDSSFMPSIHRGIVAGGDVVMKDGRLRDEVASQASIMALEMEGPGVEATFPTVVIKAGSDYADSHKNKDWQKWASMTAASCARAFIDFLQAGITPTAQRYMPRTGDAQSDIAETRIVLEATRSVSNFDVLEQIDELIKNAHTQLRYREHLEGAKSSLTCANELAATIIEGDQITPRRRVTIQLGYARYQMQWLAIRDKGQELYEKHFTRLLRNIHDAKVCAGTSTFDCHRVILYETFATIARRRFQSNFARLGEEEEDKFRYDLRQHREFFDDYVNSDGDTKWLSKEYQRQIDGIVDQTLTP